MLLVGTNSLCEKAAVYTRQYVYMFHALCRPVFFSFSFYWKTKLCFSVYQCMDFLITNCVSQIRHLFTRLLDVFFALLRYMHKRYQRSQPRLLILSNVGRTAFPCLKRSQPEFQTSRLRSLTRLFSGVSDQLRGRRLKFRLRRSVKCL